MFAYTVRCTFPTPELAGRWATWILEEHAAEVLAAGATSARLVRLDRSEPTLEVRYTYADRAAYQRYEEERAPALRAAGFLRFPPELGLQYSRETGEILADF